MQVFLDDDDDNDGGYNYYNNYFYNYNNDCKYSLRGAETLLLKYRLIQWRLIFTHRFQEFPSAGKDGRILMNRWMDEMKKSDGWMDEMKKYDGWMDEMKKSDG